MTEDHFPFTLDPFQQDAIAAIAARRSVIVSAPTGAGKTVIAEFAIEQTLAMGGRVVYTAPIKALSNQKYANFSERWPGRVGIATGDVALNTNAPVMVMTTEVLRNIGYRSFEMSKYRDAEARTEADSTRLDGPSEWMDSKFSCIILDECHFLGDPQRGTVWEEIMIQAPASVQFVALSATISNAHEIEAWMRAIHGPIVRIDCHHRPVPLTHWGLSPRSPLEPLTGHRTAPGAKHTHTYDLRHRHHRAMIPTQKVISTLAHKHLLPTLYFIFSRGGCEAAARRMMRFDPLVTREEAEAIAVSVSDFMEGLPNLSLSVPPTLLMRALQHGIGIHHAGLLPAWKRLVEQLFEKGFLKVVFATETMSLGIHMPAKSIVLESLKKRDDTGGVRLLRAGEFLQMSGRAGRRGIDTEGHCVLLTPDEESRRLGIRLIAEPPEPVVSRFKMGYATCAVLAMTFPTYDDIQAYIERSFGQFQQRLQAEKLTGQIAEEEQQLANRPSRLSDTKRLRKSIAHKKVSVTRLTGSYWAAFLRTTRVLETIDYMTESRKMSTRGFFLSGLRNDNELLVTETIFSDVLYNLKGPDVAAILSCLLEEPRTRDLPPWTSWLAHRKQMRVLLHQVELMMYRLTKVQQEAGMDFPIIFHRWYIAAVYEWASGADWTTVVTERFGGQEGDFVRILRRLIDLMRQCAENDALPPDLRPSLRKGIQCIDRDIVLESALL